MNATTEGDMSGHVSRVSLNGTGHPIVGRDLLFLEQLLFLFSSFARVAEGIDSF